MTRFNGSMTATTAAINQSINQSFHRQCWREPPPSPPTTMVLVIIVSKHQKAHYSARVHVESPFSLRSDGGSAPPSHNGKATPLRHNPGSFCQQCVFFFFVDAPFSSVRPRPHRLRMDRKENIVLRAFLMYSSTRPSWS